jgi:16S rRNA (cytosine967-C5)-methyltransferase
MHNIQLAAMQIVRQVLLDGRNLNQVLDESLQRKSVWTSAQRAALQDLSYGTLRFYGQLNAVLNLLLHKHMTDDRIGYLLLIALYQLQYSRAAQHAIVDHAVRSADILNPKIRGLVNAILRNFLRNKTDLLERAALHEEGRYNHPQWWIDTLKSQYGDGAAAILQAGNEHPPMTLRVNVRMGTLPEYLAKLTEQSILAKQIGPDALLLEKPVPVDKLPGFFAGLVSVQDAGAQYAAHLLDARSGMRVLDACAAPGGKTAHILERADVEMFALDKDESRLQRVQENLQRLKLSATLLTGDAAQPHDHGKNIIPEDETSHDRSLPCRAHFGTAEIVHKAQSMLCETPCSPLVPPLPMGEGYGSSLREFHVNHWWDGKPFERILADVPCSATGVVRRHPDIKWLRRKKDIASFAAQQTAILSSLWPLLCTDGLLLYATCSVFKQENQDVIDHFLKQQPHARQLDCCAQLLPNDEHDGFYYALLQKVA